MTLFHTTHHTLSHIPWCLLLALAMPAMLPKTHPSFICAHTRYKAPRFRMPFATQMGSAHAPQPHSLSLFLLSPRLVPLFSNLLPLPPPPCPPLQPQKSSTHAVCVLQHVMPCFFVDLSLCVAPPLFRPQFGGAWNDPARFLLRACRLLPLLVFDCGPCFSATMVRFDSVRAPYFSGTMTGLRTR